MIPLLSFRVTHNHRLVIFPPSPYSTDSKFDIFFFPFQNLPYTFVHKIFPKKFLSHAQPTKQTNKTYVYFPTRLFFCSWLLPFYSFLQNYFPTFSLLFPQIKLLLMYYYAWRKDMQNLLSVKCTVRCQLLLLFSKQVESLFQEHYLPQNIHLRKKRQVKTKSIIQKLILLYSTFTDFPFVLANDFSSFICFLNHRNLILNRIHKVTQ